MSTMTTIYKYPFEIADEFTIDLPRAARILKAECQAGQPTLWAWVDPGMPVEPVRFRLFGTGHPIDFKETGAIEHVETFQQGPFVWHLFRQIGG